MDRVLNDLIKDNESVKEDMYNARAFTFDSLITQQYFTDAMTNIFKK